MKKILITGAQGFVGKYAQSECEAAGYVVYGQDIKESADGVCSDLRDAEATQDLVEDLHPDACIHLAGVSDVNSAWQDPNAACSTNLIGTVNLLEAFRKKVPEARILTVSSSQIYDTVRVYDDFNEKVHFQPSNIYAISKLAADLTTLSYADKYGMHALTARPINHIGPGQSERFAIPAFAAQLKRMANGQQEPSMKVGNLASSREFLDVRDVVRAYRLLIERGQAGEYYNIAGGKPQKIQQVLDRLMQIAGVEPTIKVDPGLYRPTDSSPRIDASHTRRTTGWQPEIEIEQTLRNVYESIEV